MEGNSPAEDSTALLITSDSTKLLRSLVLTAKLSRVKNWHTTDGVLIRDRRNIIFGPQPFYSITVPITIVKAISPDWWILFPQGYLFEIQFGEAVTTETMKMFGSIQTKVSGKGEQSGGQFVIHDLLNRLEQMKTAGWKFHYAKNHYKSVVDFIDYISSFYEIGCPYENNRFIPQELSEDLHNQLHALRRFFSKTAPSLPKTRQQPKRTAAAVGLLPNTSRCFKQSRQMSKPDQGPAQPPTDLVATGRDSP